MPWGLDKLTDNGGTPQSRVKLFLRIMQAIAQAGGKIKYGHAEVGHIRTDDEEMSQHEIEFLPVDACDAADQLAIAKWMLSMIGYRYGVRVSFAPKISVGHAGSGMPFIAECIASDRAAAGWWLWYAVLKKENILCGSLGFKGVPDENGEAELGYGILPRFEKQGLATEAARKLCRWAMQKRAVFSFIGTS